jgi:UDP-2-acetamido-3-amino-2,3-dideoxy-glucuronate N-acetyltransferase
MTQPKYFVHDSSYVDQGAVIGEGCHIWHYCHIMSTARLGPACVLGQNVFVGAYAQLGQGCKVQNNVSIFEGVHCEDWVFIGPSAVFTNVYNPRAYLNRKDEFRHTRVREGASIGANATIICGITLGQYCFVAAGAVVRSDVPDFALVAGVPASIVGWMSRAGERLTFDGQGIAVCPETHERYRYAGYNQVEHIA